jgi:hypothetical protein
MPEHKLKKASESEAAAEIREVIGAGPDDEVLVRTPQFKRTPNMQGPGAPPKDFEALRKLNKTALKEMGCSPWDEPDDKGMVLMLFPGEWYRAIPAGTIITDIFGRKEYFSPGVTDNDIRFGCLPFGFKVRM